MRAKVLAGLVFCASIFLVSQLYQAYCEYQQYREDHFLFWPHPERYQTPKPPMGALGLPLGTFAVVEGIEHATGMRLGMDDLGVEIVNGKKPGHTYRIETEWPSQLPVKRVPGKRYVLHGYEKGGWRGVPPGLPIGESDGGGQMVWTFGFYTSFAVTSVEKVDGVMAPDARPVDPAVPLAEPNFAAKTDGGPPMGILGLPLGTWASIQVRAPDYPVLLESPFEVDKVNGRRLTKPVILSIPSLGFRLGKADGELVNERVTLQGNVILHGVENGEWENTPELPKSENPSGEQAQQPFQLYHLFYVTSQVKADK